MGRRKSKRKPPPKKKMTGTLETQFTCPFCNHEKSCDVKMDRARNTGVISCTVCLEEFQTPITCILGKPGFSWKSQCLDILGKTRPAEAASGPSSLLTHLTSTLPI
ncbi:transcription elongation factor 1 homolog isoform X1 [Zalophus californianus]|uniref:Transcription elongation factor 1 homolog n=1 Tax=Zalophus californianus TaxID=9704 RepID=A0A6J2CF91_ZALCA|nr:transcription elongation factor 1 homolog isoform X1 [Zalophus californianus]XP_027442045.1 transcription elongation factor 1 homolog isoform X1 [Zalophus californianus]XP_027442046.1 transcription elongation factor 1 homolog isoform X1 [Zalophus californianus]XP_027442047.1 transcription elongation factor 1 homolog isoform X1 [Zalophus californianus]XP_027944715.1 transcription elongation factor 1 homolog isoform X1 [Eumetopias jubatus]